MILDPIRKITTTTGLKVRATLIEKHYFKGTQVDDYEIKTLKIEKHAVHTKRGLHYSTTKHGKLFLETYLVKREICQ